MMRQRGLQRRTPLTVKTPLERGTRPLRSSGPTKARRAPMSPEEKLGRKLVSRRSEGWCEIRLPGCGNAATDWSHRIARGRGGLWDASNGLASCRSCHSLITDTNGHRAEYEDLGYIVATDADTTSVRVWLHGQRWVWLTDTGDYRNVPADCVKTWYRSEVLAERAVPGTPAAEQDEAEHVIEFREGGWTIKHPLSCRPGLFECPVNRAAEEQLTEPPEVLGRFFASLTDDGLLWVGDPADDAASAAPRSAVEEMANQACTCAPLLTSAGPRRLTALECPEHGEAK